jgi:hypothetical protein
MNLQIIMYSTTAVIVGSICACVFVFKKLRDIRNSLGPRGAKNFPITPAYIKDIAVEAMDSQGTTYRFGTELHSYFVLLLSSHCPVCHELFNFLSFNKGEIEKISPLFILTKSSCDEIKKLLSPAPYIILDDERFWKFFDSSTIPMLYSVRNNRLSGRYLVNTGEDIWSVVSPDIITV